jgi:hypothetical protein
MNPLPYLLVKADAGDLPLSGDSVSLVIATPPYMGTIRLRRGSFCTNNSSEYLRLRRQFLCEATRIVKPNAHILLSSRRKPAEKSRGARYIIFQVFKKQRSDSSWTRKQVGFEVFRTHYVDVETFPWWGLPVCLYKALLRRYSKVGDTVAHVFCGSGNGGIGALELGRKPILVDLYYHRQTRRRLDRRIRSMLAKDRLGPTFSSSCLTFFPATHI